MYEKDLKIHKMFKQQQQTPVWMVSKTLTSVFVLE